MRALLSEHDAALRAVRVHCADCYLPTLTPCSRPPLGAWRHKCARVVLVAFAFAWDRMGLHAAAWGPYKAAGGRRAEGSRAGCAALLHSTRAWGAGGRFCIAGGVLGTGSCSRSFYNNTCLNTDLMYTRHSAFSPVPRQQHERCQLHGRQVPSQPARHLAVSGAAPAWKRCCPGPQAALHRPAGRAALPVRGARQKQGQP